MRTRRPLLPPSHLPFRRIIDATDEQKAEALRLTKESATKIRDLVRELDLPAASFEAVARLYQGHEWVVVERAEIERDNAEQKQIAELVAKLREKGVEAKNAVEIGEYMPLGGSSIPRAPGYRPAMYDGLDTATNEELVALAKQHGIETDLGK